MSTKTSDLDEVLSYLKNVDGQVENSKISEELALSAYMGALIRIENRNDALYFFASMNLLNAYVKDPSASEDFKKRYKFKRHLSKGIEEVIMKNIAEVEVYLDSSVTYITVCGIQFSFHNIPITKHLKNNYLYNKANKPQSWSGVRLQPHSVFLYEWTKTNRRKGA